MWAVLITLLSAQCIHVLAGTWTEWGNWSDCHASCGNGTMTRMRVCSNSAHYTTNGLVPSINPTHSTTNQLVPGANTAHSATDAPVHGSNSAHPTTNGVVPSVNPTHFTSSGQDHAIIPTHSTDDREDFGTTSTHYTNDRSGTDATPNHSTDDKSDHGVIPTRSMKDGQDAGATPTHSTDDRENHDPTPTHPMDDWLDHGTTPTHFTTVGPDCAGAALEHRECSSNPCPDNTDWGPWTPWTHCSLTCDMGIQRRRRTCRQLGRHGETCSGDDDDSKACFIQACTDGGWSTWAPWQPCSVTCDSGMQSRNRSCDNPAPSRFGHACAGNDMDMRMCNAKPCSASQYGSQGAPPVIFSVSSPTGQLIGRHDGNGQIALFSKASINMGGAYDMASGIFTCPVVGVYRFSVALRSTHDTFCNIIKNHDVTLTYAQVSVNAERDTGFNEVFVRLSAGDIVSLECDVRWYNVDKGQGTSFNGQLMYAGV